MKTILRLLGWFFIIYGLYCLTIGAPTSTVFGVAMGSAILYFTRDTDSGTSKSGSGSGSGIGRSTARAADSGRGCRLDDVCAVRIAFKDHLRGGEVSSSVFETSPRRTTYGYYTFFVDSVLLTMPRFSVESITLLDKDGRPVTGYSGYSIDPVPEGDCALIKVYP